MRLEIKNPGQVTPLSKPYLKTAMNTAVIVICATVALLSLLNPPPGDPSDKLQDEEYILVKRKPKS